jgi:hypothetical protein
VRQMLLGVVCLVLSACGGSNRDTLDNVVGAAVLAADQAYEASVRVCDAKEKWVVARSDSTAAEDERDMQQIRRACDAVFNSFETLRNNQAKLRWAVGVLKDYGDE